MSLLLLALDSCRQGVKLPSEIKVSISEPGTYSRVSQGSYLANWNLDRVTKFFKKKLTKYLKSNRVTIEDREFINSPYRLIINNIIVDQTQTQAFKGGSNGCRLETIHLEKVDVSINVSLQKDGIEIDKWVFSETRKERVRRRSDGDDYDTCDDYHACKITFFSLKKMIKRCARQAQAKVSNRIYKTAF
ncbi:MAG TPA: hypothetical protein DCS93_11635 [Microscillaceae bacterium]|nr:hypothetical protein [Microscillaceae bacterium]